MAAAVLMTGVLTSVQGVEIIGHRGASFDAPENTLAAFKLSYEQGADATELDIHLTKDGKIAVVHDPDLKRTGGADLRIAGATLEELRRHNVGKFGRWQAQNFDEKVPQLAEVFKIVPKGKRLLIEIKCREEVLPALKKAFSESKLEARQLPIITFHYEVAKAAKELFPDHEISWLHGWSKEKTNPTVDELIRKAKEANLDGLDLNYQFPINKEFVQKVHAAGLKLYTWTVNDAAVARAERDAGVDGITTDRPGWLREQLQKAPR